MYKNERKLYTDDLILFEKNKGKPRLEELKDLEKIMEKINAKKLSEIEKIRIKYGTTKRSLPLADRIYQVHDGEFLGERIPFYNTPAVEGEDEPAGSEEEGGKKKKKEKKLAFPSKTAIWHKDPAWKIMKPSVKNAEIEEKKKGVEDEKMEKIKTKFEERKVDLTEDLVKSYNKMDKWKKLNFTYYKPEKKSETYDRWKELNPPKYPGPQQYFKTPFQTFEKKKKKAAEGDEEPVVAEGEDDEKKLYVDRKKIDKKVYKPMKGHIF